jgi:hypothetical protein
MTGLNSILKKANETLENATDTKIKLQTMALLMDLYKSIMTLTTDGGVVEQALKMVKIFKPLLGEEIPSEIELQNSSLHSEEKLQTNVVEESSNDEQDDIEPEEETEED